MPRTYRIGTMCRARSIRFSISCLFGLAGATMAQAQAPTTRGYLAGTVVVDRASAPPTPGSDADLIDLYLVRIAQRDASPAAITEAYDDAAAYFFDDLLPRFSEAAGVETPLSAAGRPVLAHMLQLVLNDVMSASRAVKQGNPRIRPYAQVVPIADDPPRPSEPVAQTGEIVPCNVFRLEPTGSYPSGHAANGYAASLLLAAVFPARRTELLRRGARYGDNRVVCGVHHPIDVERGRALARMVFERIRATPTFIADLACAKEEGSPGATPGCLKRSAGYRAEMIDRAIDRACAAPPAGASSSPRCTAPAAHATS